MTNDYNQKRMDLRKEGKIELPLNVDTKKYLLSSISWRSIAISSPLLLAAIIALYVLHNLGGLTVQGCIIVFAPFGLALTLLSITHPDRKNITFWEYRMLWKMKFKRRLKLHVYKKEDYMAKNKQADVKDQIPITNIYNDCYETKDHRFVKCIEVSSINLNLLSQNEIESILLHYENFLNDLPQEAFPLQISQIAQPINLENYRNRLKTIERQETMDSRKLLLKSYLKFVNNIENQIRWCHRAGISLFLNLLQE